MHGSRSNVPSKKSLQAALSEGIKSGVKGLRKYIFFKFYFAYFYVNSNTIAANNASRESKAISSYHICIQCEYITSTKLTFYTYMITITQRKWNFILRVSIPFCLAY
jgi:hypothetical protein